MQSPSKTFLDLPAEWSNPEKSAYRILPVPYEGGVSYGSGTGLAPNAVIEASAQVELYDEVLDTEPYRKGIATLNAPVLDGSHKDVYETLYKTYSSLLQERGMLIGIGGDHSVTPAHVRALAEKHGTLSVIQLDAHADLRKEYEGSPYSHACVMNQVLELTPNTLQMGIRSLSAEEAQRIKDEELNVCHMHEFRDASFRIGSALASLPDPVFITLDVDALDWSVVASTGTPEPGGFTWDETLALLKQIFDTRTVVGFDVVELSAGDRNSEFAIAKLIYKMIGFHADSVSK